MSEVTVIRVKNHRPTVIEWQGMRYHLDPNWIKKSPHSKSGANDRNRREMLPLQDADNDSQSRK